MTTDKSRKRSRFGAVAADPLRLLGLQTLFSGEEGYEIVPLTGENALQSEGLSLVIVDAACTTHLFELIASFGRVQPALKLIVVGLEQDSAYIERVIGAGAKGYLTHDASAKEIRMAVEIILDGSIWAPRKVLARLIERGRAERGGRDDTPVFTRRERDVLALLVGGWSNREIGTALAIDEATVKAHVGRLMRKVGVKNRTALTVHAMERKLLQKVEGPTVTRE